MTRFLWEQFAGGIIGFVIALAMVTHFGFTSLHGQLLAGGVTCLGLAVGMLIGIKRMQE